MHPGANQDLPPLRSAYYAAQTGIRPYVVRVCPTNEKLTDVVNAHQLVYLFGNRLLTVPGWVAWRGTHWPRDKHLYTSLLLNCTNDTLDLSSGDLRPEREGDPLPANSLQPHCPVSNLDGLPRHGDERQPAANCLLAAGVLLHHGNGRNGKTTLRPLPLRWPGIMGGRPTQRRSCTRIGLAAARPVRMWCRWPGCG